MAFLEGVGLGSGWSLLGAGEGRGCGAARGVGVAADFFCDEIFDHVVRVLGRVGLVVRPGPVNGIFFWVGSYVHRLQLFFRGLGLPG